MFKSQELAIVVADNSSNRPQRVGFFGLALLPATLTHPILCGRLGFQDFHLPNDLMAILGLCGYAWTRWRNLRFVTSHGWELEAFQLRHGSIYTCNNVEFSKPKPSAILQGFPSWAGVDHHNTPSTNSRHYHISLTIIVGHQNSKDKYPYNPIPHNIKDPQRPLLSGDFMGFHLHIVGTI